MIEHRTASSPMFCDSKRSKLEISVFTATFLIKPIYWVGYPAV
jgi:hypothetical protein